MPADPDDSSIRVLVTPSQSSYFAGEPFSVTISLTNTRSPNADPGSSSSRARTPGSGHRRGVHSISSAPLARPPTSPGTPRMPPPPPPMVKVKGKVEKRLGLIGVREDEKREKGKESEVGDLMEQRRKKLLSRNLSVAIDSREMDELRGATKSASYAQSSFTVPSPTGSKPSPLSRTATFPSDHPHARKNSVLDGQFIISPPPAPPPPPEPPHTGSTSTFTLPLDPISEGAHPYIQSTASLVGPTIEVPKKPFTPPLESENGEGNANGNGNHVYAYPPLSPPAQPQKHRPAQLEGIGRTPTSPLPPSLSSRKTSIPPHPNAETILYAYAQLAGSLTITPLPIATPAQEENLRRVKRKLGRGRVVGGGSMDISSSISSSSLPKRKPGHGHGRSASFSAGLMALISPRPWGRSVSGSFGSPSTPSTPTFPGSFPPVPPREEEDVDPEAPLPTFEGQPAMLGVDLWLLPGETKSYTYTIHLPQNLPPTFRGKAMKVSYELVVGTCRASAGGASVSRVMKVPIRVYNHVSVTQSPKPYDILWPIRKSDVDVRGKVVEVTSSSSSSSSNAQREGEPERKGTAEELKRYARRLVSTLPPVQSEEEGKGKEKGVRIKVPAEAIGGWEKGQGGEVEDMDMPDGEESGGCREAVEVLTRNMKKASYDVTKDGVKVAVLTFSKSAYRLGETITGVVEVNERIGRARVVKLSATLEAHELLPASICPPSAARHLRRAHAEHYASFTLNTLRTTFALDIPSDAAPVFGVSIPSELGQENAEVGGLEWKVRLCLLVGIASPNASTGTEGVVFKSLVRDGPRGEWGSSFRAPGRLAPLEKAPPLQQQEKGWGSFFGFGTEREYHDGDDLGEEEEPGYDGIKPDLGGGVGIGVDYGGGEEGWREVRMETVECEVPVGVWAGNTVYRSQEVVFNV